MGDQRSGEPELPEGEGEQPGPAVGGLGVSWAHGRPPEGVHVQDGIVALVTVGGQKSVKLSGDENVVSKVSHHVIDDPAPHVPARATR